MADSTLYPKLNEQFKVLLRESCGLDLVTMDSLPGDASRRRYFRLHHNRGTLIGVHGEDDRENRSFLYFCKHFYSMRLSVPRWYAGNMDKGIYVVEDLGNKTLAEISSDPASSREEIIDLYRQSVRDLVYFQILGHKDLDYENNCHQNAVFDRENIQLDLQYFTNYFLVLTGEHLKTSGIVHELDKLTEILMAPQPIFFLYRDFQCRNIIVRPSGGLGYIDFQAGRKGPLQYDVATLLYASKANLSPDERELILGEYLDQLEQVMPAQDDSKSGGTDFNPVTPISRDDFLARYHFFVLFRILRALGVYLFLAVREEQWRFLEAVPLALENLAAVFLERGLLCEAFPELRKLAERLSSEESFLSSPGLKELVNPEYRLASGAFEKSLETPKQMIA